MLYSTTKDISRVTLVSTEMRGAYLMAKEELVRKLLYQRSPRLAKVMAVIGGDPSKGKEGAAPVADIEGLYAATVQIERQYYCGAALSPEPSIVPGDFIVSVRLAVCDQLFRLRVENWAIPLEVSNSGSIDLIIPAHIVEAVGLPKVTNSDYEQNPFMLVHGVKVYFTSTKSEGYTTAVVYCGQPNNGDDGDSEGHYASCDSKPFNRCLGSYRSEVSMWTRGQGDDAYHLGLHFSLASSEYDEDFDDAEPLNHGDTLSLIQSLMS